RSSLPSPSQSATQGAASPVTLIGFPAASRRRGLPKTGPLPLLAFGTSQTSPSTVPTIKSTAPVPFQSTAKAEDALPTLIGLPSSPLSVTAAANLPSLCRRKK